ncbi:hypothetical protein Ddc_01434 [Ditylenchus destructor]|nr:hypothetical protein Ddc_01434 [Ditylenchus destructor]
MLPRAICRLYIEQTFHCPSRSIARTLHFSTLRRCQPFKASFSSHKGPNKTDLSEKFYKSITKLCDKYENPIWRRCVHIGGIFIGTAFVCGSFMCLVMILYTGWNIATKFFYGVSNSFNKPLPITEKEIHKKIEEQENNGYVAAILNTVEGFVEEIKSLFSPNNEDKSGIKSFLDPRLEKSIENYINSAMQAYFQDIIKHMNEMLSEIEKKTNRDTHIESRLRQLLQQCENRSEQMKTSVGNLMKDANENMEKLDSHMQRSLKESKEEVTKMESRLDKVKNKFCDEMDARLENGLKKFSHDVGNQQATVLKENDVNLSKALKLAEEKAALMTKSLQNEIQMLDSRAQNLKESLTPVVREVARIIQKEFKEKSSDLEMELAGFIDAAENKSEKLVDYLRELIDSMDGHLKVLESDFVKALEVAKQRMIDSSIALPLEEATHEAEQKVLEATVARLNQRQAIVQHKHLGIKRKDEFEDIERMANFVVERKIEAAYEAVEQLKRAIEQENPGGERNNSSSVWRTTEKMEKLKRQIDDLHDKKGEH